MSDHVTALDQLARMWQHLRWANAELARALRDASTDVTQAQREFAHLIAVEEVWLARLESRPPRSAVWPDLSADATASLAAETVARYEGLLTRLTDAQLRVSVGYTNSAGQAFETQVGDILLHVALHGQYHRGRVNLLMRQSGCEPAPVDYSTFVRRTPAPPGVAADAAPPT